MSVVVGQCQGWIWSRWPRHCRNRTALVHPFQADVSICHTHGGVSK